MTDHELDGITFNWNVFPSTRLEASQLLTPIGCLYTPLHKRDVKHIPIPTGFSCKYQPIVCPKCDNYINNYAKIDRVNKMWWCPFCEERTFFPDNYVLPPQNPTSDDEIPVELRQSSSTIVYDLPEDISSGAVGPSPLAFVFVLDVYQNIDDVQSASPTQFEKLITRVIESIELLPESSLISVITYDELVHVHKIATANSSVSFSYEELFGSVPEGEESGKNGYNFDRIFQDDSLRNRINKDLGIVPNVPYEWQESPLVKNGFFTELNLDSKPAILDNIRTLAFKLTPSYKPLRQVGLAHYITSYLLSLASYKGFIGKVLVFMHGPGTLEPGSIVDPQPASRLRSHNDIVNLEAPKFISSSKFYEVLGNIATGYLIEDAASAKAVNVAEPLPHTPRFSFDVYACALDQVGLYEMKSMILLSCGQVFLSESFHSFQFRDALKTSIEKAIDFNSTKYNCKLTVSTSRGAKVHKLLGHGNYLPSYYQQHQKLADLQHERISDTLNEFDSSTKKINFTNQWWFNKLADNEDTLAIYFEIDTVSSSNKLHAFTGVKHVYIQYRLKYWDGTSWKLRVTTVMKPTTLFILSNHQVRMTDGSYKLVNSKSKIIKERDLLASFDYKAWMILLTRLLINKIDSSLGYGDFKTVVKQADSILIRLLHYFGGISVDKYNDGSFNPYENIMSYYKINENFERLPSLMYNLRRNPQLINIFNSSPDETAYYHYWFLKANVESSILMIEPRFILIDEKGGFDSVQSDSNILTIPSSENKVLVMDSIFNIIIYYYSNKFVLHPSDNEELVYGDDESIKSVMKLIKDQEPKHRQVVPKYVLTKNGHSQARFLISRLSPQLTYSDKKESEGFFSSLFKKLSFEDSNAFRYDSIKTDEISTKEYYDGLIKMVKNYRVEHDY